MISEALTRRRTGGRAWTPGLNRYAFANSLSAAGDAMVTVSLAGSLFFSISPAASREQVLIYLLLAMVPFVLLAPLIGPALDRSPAGDRWVVALLFAMRGVFALALAATLYELWFYLFALAILITSKASGITKQALVPGLVSGPSELVAANARLARLSTIVGGIGGVAGAVIAATTSATVSLVVACGVFAVAAAIATTLPPLHPTHVGVSPELVEQVEYRATHNGVLVSSSWAYTVMRVAVGFFVFGTAFALRRESEPPWLYGAAAVAYGAGVFAGNAAAPLLKLRHREDRLIVGSMIVLAVVAAFGAAGPSRVLVLTFAVVLGAAVGVGRQAFDALAQSRSPIGTRGRTFARFETWFQLGWVAGAVLATAIGIPVSYSMAVVAAGMVATALFYRRAVAAARRLAGGEPFDAIEVARRRLGFAAEWRQLDRPRLAVAEMASALDLSRATGVDVEPDVVAAVERLRLAAVAGDPIDGGQLGWAMGRVRCLVADLETLDCRQRDQSGSTTEVDVTVQPAEASSMVITRSTRSSSER